MSRKSQSKKFSCNLESLERRDLMAGNVTVEFKDGDLIITGDNSSNSIEIYQTSLDNYRIVGKSAGGSATRINGRVDGSVSFNLNDTRFKDDINIYMKGGHDRVYIRGRSAEFWDIDAHDEMFISMGSGNDEVKLEYVQTGRDLDIELGSGRDSIWAEGLDIGDDLTITKVGNGTSSDSAAIFLVDSEVDDDLTINSTKSVDTVNIARSATDDLFVSLGEGDDGLNLHKTRARVSHSLDGGAGDDDLNLFKNPTSFSNRSSFKRPTSFEGELLY